MPRIEGILRPGIGPPPLILFADALTFPRALQGTAYDIFYGVPSPRPEALAIVS